MGTASTKLMPRVAFALFYALVLVLGVALGVRVIVDGYSPVPYADLWGLLSFVERGLRGDFGLSDLWAQWNEHRFFVARIHLLVDYRFFEGTNVYLFVSIATSCLLLAGTFAAAVWFDTRDWLLALGTLSVAGTSALPLAGLENLTLAVQVSFVQVFLWATVSVLAVVMAARSTVTSRQALGSGVAAIAAITATYSLANGLLTWVVVVLLAVVLRLERRCTAALVTVGLITTATYLWHYQLIGERSYSDPVALAHYVVVYLGAAPTPTPGIAAVVGAAGLILLLLLCGLVWLDRFGHSILVPFGAGVAAFIALTAAQTATGRVDLGVSQALASRYSIASYTFWLGLFVGFFPLVRERLRSVSLAVPGYLAGAAVVALVISYGALPPSSELRSFVVGREATVVAYRTGVEDLFSSSIPGLRFGPGVTSALRFMEHEKLGPWSPGGMVDAMRVTGPSNRTDRECLGQLDSKTSVPGGTRLQGWIAPPAGETSSPDLVVLDAAGRRIGLGLVGLHRPDVDQPDLADREWRGFVAYVRGKPTSPLDVVVLTDDGASAVCRLRASLVP
jgi:hypothetical protein